MTLDPEDSSSWDPIDISDPTVTVIFRKIGTTINLATLACTKVAPYTGGECFMTWGTTTLDVAAGLYEGEIVLTYDSGAVQTLFDRLKFKVRDDF